ncbi:MAG: biotin transporter BioY [Peptococcaceae bacterium]|nr:biotin transporter BioY [Peptococcaceae bacterium]
MNGSQPVNLRMTVYASLFTALVIVGGYISFPVPFSPVPLVLSDFFVMLAGLFLGPAWGLTAIGLFIFLGALGLPVFAGGKAGLAVLFGPTGGFLAGFLACVLVVGLIAGKGRPSVIKDLAALIAGNVVLYALGVPWLKAVLNITWGKALALGMIPFMPGTAVKIIAALGLAQFLRPRFTQIISSRSGMRE